MSPSEYVIETVTAHIREFVERPHAAFNGQPVCPFARRARKAGRVRFSVQAYSLEEYSAVLAEAEQFDPLEHDVLLVLHPDPVGISFADLWELATRFNQRFAGRLSVFTGHPADPYRRNGLQTRVEPFPNLQFISSALVSEAEARLRGRSRD